MSHATAAPMLVASSAFSTNSSQLPKNGRWKEQFWSHGHSLLNIAPTLNRDTSSPAHWQTLEPYCDANSAHGSGDSSPSLKTDGCGLRTMMSAVQESANRPIRGKMAVTVECQV